MRILSIDPGLTNMGMAIAEGTPEACRVVRFERVDLVAGVPRAKRADYVGLVRRLIDARPEDFAADRIVVERQMSAKFRIMQTAFQCFLWPRVVLVSPGVVKRHLGSRGLTYKDNKTRAVRACKRFLTVGQRIQLARMTKQDDVCDAVNQGVFAMCALPWAAAPGGPAEPGFGPRRPPVEAEAPTEPKPPAVEEAE